MIGKVVIENEQKKIQALTADTGTGAPVGSIIVVCSNILPSGYLGLGVQYDITNYPALYQVLGTDTTPTASALGLPTLSSGQYAIKATSGLTENQQENVLNTINENNSYSTEEHPTGAKWIDGKPIYKKVLIVPTTIIADGNSYKSLGVSYPNDAETMFPLTIFNLACNALYYNSYKPIQAATQISGGITIEAGTEIIIKYTKTTD